MRLHVPSFLLGVGVGVGSASIAPRLRAVVLEIATTFYRLGDSVLVRVERGREDISDLLAEAKARARGRAPRVSAGPRAEA